MRTRKLRAKKKILVTLKTQQNKTPPSTNTRKVDITTMKTTVKTPSSRMQKTPRKKLHRGTKENRCRRIRRRGLTTAMVMMTEQGPRTTTATATATLTADVTGMPSQEEVSLNGWGS